VGDFNALPPDAAQKKGFDDEPESDFTTDKTIAMILNETSLKAAFLGSNAPADTHNFSFPSDNPTRKLDYIFYNHERIQLVEAYSVQLHCSDHWPLVMKFTMK
jgi:endonuclease/exonuclease/phosphatase family metal-dependent hydrolase